MGESKTPTQIQYLLDLCDYTQGDLDKAEALFVVAYGRQPTRDEWNRAGHPNIDSERCDDG
jgi:hypothetical protein